MHTICITTILAVFVVGLFLGQALARNQVSVGKTCVSVVGFNSQWEPLFQAIAEVESGRDAKAFNEAEGAVGYVQIRPICLKDCNRILDRPLWTLEDRWEIGRSREMFLTYLQKYTPGCANGVNYEDAARIWNGGPTGHRKSSTVAYWNKVKKVLVREGVVL